MLHMRERERGCEADSDALENLGMQLAGKAATLLAASTASAASATTATSMALAHILIDLHEHEHEYPTTRVEVESSGAARSGRRDG